MILKSGKIFLFQLRNGKYKIGYGDTPEHAKKILGYRLSKQEMSELTEDEPAVITQRELRQWVPFLG